MPPAVQCEGVDKSRTSSACTASCSPASRQASEAAASAMKTISVFGPRPEAIFALTETVRVQAWRVRIPREVL